MVTIEFDADKDGKMVNVGVKGTDEEFERISALHEELVKAGKVPEFKYGSDTVTESLTSD